MQDELKMVEAVKTEEEEKKEEEKEESSEDWLSNDIKS